MSPIRWYAYAKLTLSLHVTGVRSDGFHELDALVVSVSEPHDELVLRPADALSISVHGPHAAGVPDDDTNLAVRAAKAAGARVAIDLHKGIPPGAGLGGGSADAAAILVANPVEDYQRTALTLGADVLFCVDGGAARMRGIGELLERVSLPVVSVVIATPTFGCATADVYREWDALGGPEGRTVELDGLPPLRNDLEPAAQHLETRLIAFRNAIETAAGAPALLAGSGSSYFVVFYNPVDAEAARARVADAVDGQVVVGHTVDAGVESR